MDRNFFPADAFGDSFNLDHPQMPRPAVAYAVQRLDTDTLLDQRTRTFQPIRSQELEPRFASFDAAHQAASNWLLAQGQHNTDDHCLAIVPIGYDEILQRHILIYGVLRATP